MFVSVIGSFLRIVRESRVIIGRRIGWNKSISCLSHVRHSAASTTTAVFDFWPVKWIIVTFDRVFVLQVHLFLPLRWIQSQRRRRPDERGNLLLLPRRGLNLQMTRWWLIMMIIQIVSLLTGCCYNNRTLWIKMRVTIVSTKCFTNISFILC